MTADQGYRTRSLFNAFSPIRDSKIINHPRISTDHPVQVGQLKLWESLRH
jgi:hypothetical protein